MFADIEATGWVLIITAVSSGIGGLFVSIGGLLKLWFEIRRLAVVTHDTHTLVNSNMGVQLKIAAVALRRLAVISNDPVDLAAAELAETSLAEHVAKQAIVDAKMR